MILDFDAWFYKGSEGRIIRAGEAIPEGWTDHPTDFNGADPEAFNHDGVGGPGGSLKRGPGRPRKVQP